MVDAIDFGLDVNTGEHRPVTQLGLNDLGRVRLRTTTPVIFDPYRRNRTTGPFILVDEATNTTVEIGSAAVRERGWRRGGGGA